MRSSSGGWLAKSRLIPERTPLVMPKACMLSGISSGMPASLLSRCSAEIMPSLLAGRALSTVEGLD